MQTQNLQASLFAAQNLMEGENRFVCQVGQQEMKQRVRLANRLDFKHRSTASEIKMFQALKEEKADVAKEIRGELRGLSVGIRHMTNGLKRKGLSEEIRERHLDIGDFNLETLKEVHDILHGTDLNPHYLDDIKNDDVFNNVMSYLEDLIEKLESVQLPKGGSYGYDRKIVEYRIQLAKDLSKELKVIDQALIKNREDMFGRERSAARERWDEIQKNVADLAH